MSEVKYQQCVRCVMDTSDPEIVFDDKGICNHCTNFYNRLSNRTYKGAESDRELVSVIEKIKKAGVGNEYDCILGISGGIDSCYAAYILKQHGVRVLLVHMDNGWNSEEAVKNIKYVAEKLGYDYQSYVLDWEEFKDIQLAFLKASVIEAETPTDIAIPGVMYQVAKSNNVKFIISGGNFATEGILPRMWHYNAKDLTYFNAIHKKFGTKKIKDFPLYGFMKEMYQKVVLRTRYVYLLNYVPYSKKDAVDLLERELNWKYYGGKHYESKFTGFVQSYILPTKFNLDYRKATLSSQICAGDTTREEALEELKKLPYNPDNVKGEMEYISKKLGITMDEFKQILSLPPKTYKDYPNDYSKLQFFYDIYNKYFRSFFKVS